MAEIINLRQRRKQATRAAREKTAEQNRVTHGRSKASRKLDEANRDLENDRLSGHRRSPDDD